MQTKPTDLSTPLDSVVNSESVDYIQKLAQSWQARASALCLKPRGKKYGDAAMHFAVGYSAALRHAGVAPIGLDAWIVYVLSMHPVNAIERAVKGE